MTVFHLIGKHFRKDCVPPNWEKFRNDCVPQHLEMPVLHQVEKSLEMTVPPNWGKFKWLCSTKFENSLEMTVLHQTEESLKWPYSTTLLKVLKMNVFHQIGKHFRNDCFPPNWEKFITDCVPQHLEMPVLPKVEKSLEPNWGSLKWPCSIKLRIVKKWQCSTKLRIVSKWLCPTKLRTV